MILLRLLSFCPLWLLHGVGAMLGVLTWLSSPSYRARCAENLTLAGLSGWRMKLAAMAQSGRMLMEIPWLWLRPADKVLGRWVRWDHRELITSQVPGQGLLLLTPHMGCFEVTAQAFAEIFGATQGKITVLYRPARQRWVREMVESSRQRPGLDTAPASLAGVRQMLRALRRGETVGLLPDQVPPEGQGVWAPFFGKPAYTMTLAAKLQQQTGARLVLLWGERLPWGRGYVVHTRPGPDIPPDSSPECAAEIINKAMQTLILEKPAQYLWGYNRYKNPRREASA